MEGNRHQARGNSAHHSHGDEKFIWKYVFSTDHKMIAKQYLFTGLFMALVGAFTAYLMRWQLAYPNTAAPGWGVVTADKFNMLVTMHGTIMVFFVGMPVLVAALSNFVIPLQIGARDMVFPRLNMLSYWVFVASVVCLLASFFVPAGASACGWTGYPPLSASQEYTGIFWGVVLWILALALEFASFTMGGINYLATFMCARAKGLTYSRVPLATWFLVGASLAFFFSVGPLIAGAIMLLLDNVAGTGFYLPQKGGEPLLWQHLFWFFGHPEVYVVFLPGLAAVLEIIPVFSRKPIFGYRTMVWSMAVALALSYVVWAHHMFISGMDPRLAMPFSITTILISVPFAIIIFCMLASLRGGSIRLATPMLWAVGFLVTFLIGGLTGIFLGSAASNIYFHGTYFVVAHFHYTFFPAVFFGGFAAIHFWFPKMFGRMYSERLGKIHFWLTFVFFNCTFWPIFQIGSGGMIRRIADPSQYRILDQFKTLNVFVTISAFILIAGQIVFVINFFWSIFRGPAAEANPFRANTLEWSAASPPPHGNFTAAPVVYRGPYEYSLPDRAEDFVPQNEPPLAQAEGTA